jgi:hypothetical protein
VIVGKNRHEEGYSTVEITVSRRDAPVGQSGSDSAPKIEDAAL